MIRVVGCGTQSTFSEGGARAQHCVLTLRREDGEDLQVYVDEEMLSRFVSFSVSDPDWDIKQEHQVVAPPASEPEPQPDPEFYEESVDESEEQDDLELSDDYEDPPNEDWFSGIGDT